MSRKITRHPRNAPGPFYVAYGECTACLAAHQTAPEMMGYDEAEGHCFVRRQPSGPHETYRALCAVWCSEVAAIRYAGNDPEVLRRLGEAGLAQQCDEPLPVAVRPCLRNHVSFAVKGGLDEPAVTEQGMVVHVAHDFAKHLEQGSVEWWQYRITPFHYAEETLSFALSWGSEAHEIRMTTGEAGTDRLLIAHSPTIKAGSQAVSLILQTWLRGHSRFYDLRWYTADA
ncbi:MAG TPA: ferredoxin [Chloroflexia bacterium]|nr:ferredoxin [Chloroflexia bacterium]